MTTSWNVDPLDYTYETHILERARRYISSSLLADDWDPPYAIEFSQQRMAEDFITELRMQATALYGYCRFNQEGPMGGSFVTPKTTYKAVPASGLDYFKSFVEKWVRRANSAFTGWHHRHQQRVGKYNNPVHLSVPGRWKPRYRSFNVIAHEDWDICIDRIQEALVSQMRLMLGYGLKPQAVLSSPDIAHKLVASQALSGHDKWIVAGESFMGLRVIACEHLRYGAIVV